MTRRVDERRYGACRVSEPERRLELFASFPRLASGGAERSCVVVEAGM